MTDTQEVTRAGAADQLSDGDLDANALVAANLRAIRVHWWRTQVARATLWNAPGLSHGTWWSAERGIDARTGFTSVRLVTFIDAATLVGLEVRWVSSSSPWRRRPWQAPDLTYRTP